MSILYIYAGSTHRLTDSLTDSLIYPYHAQEVSLLHTNNIIVLLDNLIYTLYRKLQMNIKVII